MSDKFIPLNHKQEEAWGEVCRFHAMHLVRSKVLKYMVENLGSANKHTINLRLMLNELLDNKMEKLVEDSGLSEVFMKRLKQENN